MSKWKSSKVKAITTLKSLTDPFAGLFGPDIKAKVGLYFNSHISNRQQIPIVDRKTKNKNQIKKATRHDFNAKTKTWETEEIEVKILPDSFAEGSLRQAFKAKYIHKGAEWSTARCMVVKG